jgi:hypothetical protein
MKNARTLLPFLPLVVAACGGKVPAVPLRPPVASASATSKGPPPAPPRPAPLAASMIGSFGEGTFGPRLARNGKSAIVVSASRADTGRRWIAIALDEKDAPIGSAKHEIAEAPEDSSAWDLKPVGDGFVLSWTRPSDSGEQLLSVALASDGSPRSAPSLITKSSDDLVAVRLTPLAEGAGALLTYGEKIMPKGAVAASGSLYAIAIDALGRPSAPTPTRVAERLSAWQIAAVSRDTAVAAIVQRDEAGKKGELAAQNDVPRAARAITLALTPKGIVASDALTLVPSDVLPEIDVVATSPGRALIVWSDRREMDAHLFAMPVDVTGKSPKSLGPAKRAVPPRGDQAIIAMVPSKTGAVVLWEAVSPRSIRDPRRRFELVRLSDTGEALATPRAFHFPYENDEPELVRAGDDDVAVLTYGSACLFKDSACDGKEIRPWIVRLSGPSLTPKQTDLVDVSGMTAAHAFDLGCPNGKCEVLAEGAGNPASVMLAKSGAPNESDLRWAYRELIDVSSTPPRLEGATAIGREPEFTGLHATRAGAGTLVGWITYAPDTTDVETVEEIKGKKGKIEKKVVKKPKAAEGGARVAVRLLDGSGEPMGPVQTISEKALSKGDVAVAWGESSGVVAYVSRAEGDEEVYVARIDKKGNKDGKSSRISNAPGPASDVALTALAEGGYVLSWVEARKGGAPAVYAVKLDKGGGKVGTEVKIGGGIGGDISDLSLATVGGKVVAVWADARDDATHGYADIYYTVITPKDLKASVLEKAIARTKTHSHYPVVVPRGDGGATIAWVEDDPSSSEFLELTGRDGWGAKVARIDAQGAIVQNMTEVPVDPALGKGVATGVSIDCPSGPSTCHIAIAWAAREGIAMLGTTLGNTVAPARVVWSWYGAPSQEVAPAVVGGAVYACEDGLEKDDGRVRRLSVAW